MSLATRSNHALASLLMFAVSASFSSFSVAHAGPPEPAAPACKAYDHGGCCDAKITAHLAQKAVQTACGETDATFLGEQATKDGCKYFYKVEGGKPEDGIVQIYAPNMKDVPASPQLGDPFFTWKRVGKAWMIERANSPKAAAMSIGQSGLWMAGKGYYVNVTASQKVCTKAQATKLAASMH